MRAERLRCLRATFPLAKPLVGEFGPAGEYLIGNQEIKHLLTQVAELTKEAANDDPENLADELFPNPQAPLDHIETRMWHNHFGILNDLLPSDDAYPPIPGLSLVEGEFDRGGLFYYDTTPDFMDPFCHSPVRLRRYLEYNRGREDGLPQSLITLRLHAQDMDGRYVVEDRIDRKTGHIEKFPYSVSENYFLLKMTKRAGATSQLKVWPGETSKRLLTASIVRTGLPQRVCLDQRYTDDEAYMRLFFWQLNRAVYPDLKFNPNLKIKETR